MYRVMVVDDEEQVARTLTRLLRRDYEVSTFRSGNEALAMLGALRPDVVISDFRMPGMSGAEFLCAVRNQLPQAIRMMVSGFGDDDPALSSMSGACMSVPKPWNNADLLALLARLLEKRASEELARAK